MLTLRRSGLLLVARSLEANLILLLEEVTHLTRQVLHDARKSLQLALLLMLRSPQAFHMSVAAFVLTKSSGAEGASQLVSSVSGRQIVSTHLIKHLERANVLGQTWVTGVALRLIQLGSQLI